MGESTGTAMKRPMELSVRWTLNGEDAEAEADDINPIPKRPCRRTDGDSFEEFLAVLKRIKASRRYFLRTPNDLNRQEPALKCVKTIASNASWRPSFEWEDFPNHGKNRDVEPGLSAVKAGDRWVGEEDEDVVRHVSNNLKPEDSTNCDLDLNSLPGEKPEASTNPDLDLNSLPGELRLFQ